MRVEGEVERQNPPAPLSLSSSSSSPAPVFWAPVSATAAPSGPARPTEGWRPRPPGTGRSRRRWWGRPEREDGEERLRAGKEKKNKSAASLPRSALPSPFFFFRLTPPATRFSRTPAMPTQPAIRGPARRAAAEDGDRSSSLASPPGVACGGAGAVRRGRARLRDVAGERAGRADGRPHLTGRARCKSMGKEGAGRVLGQRESGEGVRWPCAALSIHCERALQFWPGHARPPSPKHARGSQATHTSTHPC